MDSRLKGWYSHIGDSYADLILLICQFEAFLQTSDTSIALEKVRSLWYVILEVAYQYWRGPTSVSVLMVSNIGASTHQKGQEVEHGHDWQNCPIHNPDGAPELRTIDGADVALLLYV